MQGLEILKTLAANNVGPAEAKAKAWFKREEAKLIAAEKKLAERRAALSDAYREKLDVAERGAFSAMRQARYAK